MYLQESGQVRIHWYLLIEHLLHASKHKNGNNEPEIDSAIKEINI